MDLLAHSPQFDTDEAAALAERLFGIHASATPLPSERDQNFLLTTVHKAKLTGETPVPRLVLKIANALEHQTFLQAQNEALTHISKQLTLCPRVVFSISGREIEPVESNGVTHFVRVLTYLAGAPLGLIKDPLPTLWTNLGRELGRLDNALLSFDHPAIHRDFHWDLANGLKIIQAYGESIDDEALRDLIHGFGRDFEEKIAPLLAHVGRSVIHGDANDFNVLVDGDRVAGLIDFGDLVHSFTVGEPAVAIAYAVLDKPDPLTVASLIAAAYNQEHPLSENETRVLWPLVLMRLCMSVCLAAHQSTQRPDNSYLDISQAAIRRSLPNLMRIATDLHVPVLAPDLSVPVVEADLSVRPVSSDAVRKAAHTGASPPITLERTLSRRRQLLAPNLSVAYQEPLKIVRGSLQYLYDHEGREYLDAYNNVAHVGHCHPAVVQAAQEQMARLNTNTRYLHDAINSFAERLTSALPPPLRVCYFVNSGSEANELALRLARAHTSARDVIVLDHAYHGNTTTMIDISPYKHDGPGGEGAPAWVHKVPLPDLYRGLYQCSAPQASEKYAQHVGNVIHDLQSPGAGLSAFIAESLPSVAGQIVFPPGYLAKVYEAVRAAGGVCIADEVQTGYGRIGTHFWGFESQAVVPDIVVLGKPIGNGHPIGAVITTSAIAASFANGMEFFSTFGGNTVSSVIGLAVLQVVLAEELQGHALSVGEPMLAGLRDLMARHELIGDVRGSGFFLGVELVRDRDSLEPATTEADLVVNRMRQEGVLIGTDGPFHNVLKIRPPMPFSAADADRLLTTLNKALK